MNRKGTKDSRVLYIEPYIQLNFLQLSYLTTAFKPWSKLRRGQPSKGEQARDKSELRYPRLEVDCLNVIQTSGFVTADYIQHSTVIFCPRGHLHTAVTSLIQP